MQRPPIPTISTPDLTRRQIMLGSAAGLLTSQAGLGGFAAAADLDPKRVEVHIPNSTKRVVTVMLRAFTNRQSTGAVSVTDMFGNERGATTYGKFECTMVYDHGQAAPVSADLRLVERLDENRFADLSRYKGFDGTVRLVVHGYNHSFCDALIMAARLKARLGPDTPMFVQSWPSATGPLAYINDVNEIDYAMPVLENAILSLLRSADVGRLQIIAHSLGSRAVVAALNRIYRSADQPLLRRISVVVLAAPDVDQGIMDRDYLPVAKAAGFETLLYVSNRDMAMSIAESLLFWRHSRVGSTHKKIYVRPGIVTTVEVSQVDNSWWGHSLFESNRVAADLHFALNLRLTPAARLLRPKTSLDGEYWCIPGE